MRTIIQLIFMYTHKNIHAAIYDIRSSMSVFSGEGCAEHLDNVLTSDVSKLSDTERIDGLVCDSNGRVADIISCFGIGSEILILGIYENMEMTRGLLTKGIPWDRELLLYDGNDALRHCLIHGEGAMEMLGVLYPEISAIPNNSFVTVGDVIISKNTIFGEGNIDVIHRVDDDSFIQRVMSNDIRIRTSVEWESVRIGSGYPSENEADSTRLPTDIGMGKLVSLNKGCYPGQEIHARLDSRGSTKRHMVSISCSEPIVLGKQKLDNGLTVHVTSTVELGDMYMALAIVPIEIEGGYVKTASGEKFEIM